MSNQTLSLPGRPDEKEAGKGFPLWPLLLLLAAAVYAVMPFVHQAVYGPELILDAALRDISVRVGADLSEQGRQMLAENFSFAPNLTSALVSFAATLITVVLAGVLINFGTTLAVSRITPAQALSAAAWAAVVVALFRVFVWGVLLLVQGRESLTGLGWLSRGSVNLAGWAPEGASSLVLYALATADLTLLPGAVVVALALTQADRQLSLPTALLIGACWPLTVLVSKVVMSAMLGFPIS